jgi:enoyl-CoA hydratase/carnithine racemase
MSLPNTTGIELELVSVYRLYAALARQMDPESGLGGTLLFAGELDQAGCRLVRAANIAGAASLAASADANVARQAMRDGVVDFVVTSLDEALRILKNEIRKRQPVAVGVAVSPQSIVQEMLERGVLPDLLPPALLSSQTDLAEPDFAVFLAQGARRVAAQTLPSGKTFLALPIPAAWTRRTAEFDALVLEFLAPDDDANRRWLSLSPRYLGTQARRIRSLECGVETATRLVDQLGQTSRD